VQLCNNAFAARLMCIFEPSNTLDSLQTAASRWFSLGLALEWLHSSAF